MSKGLEALENLKKQFSLLGIKENDYLPIIEKELKEYEKMKVIKGTTTFDKAIENTLINACPDVAKKLKTLDIIKKKDVHKTMLSLTQSVDEYNYFIDDVSEEMQLTQEEYDLLKEVFNK